MKKIILFAFISFIAPLFGTVFTGTVTGDTYIRSDAGLMPYPIPSRPSRIGTMSG